jgi:hypothetical protein
MLGTIGIEVNHGDRGKKSPGGRESFQIAETFYPAEAYPLKKHSVYSLFKKDSLSQINPVRIFPAWGKRRSAEPGSHPKTVNLRMIDQLKESVTWFVDFC